MPHVNQVYVDAVLTNVSVAYQNAALVGTQLLPPVEVVRESGLYYKYGKERFRTHETLRAPRAEARQVDWKATPATYQTHEHALASLIDDRERANAQSPLALETDTTELLTDSVLLSQERRIAALVTSTDNLKQNKTLVSADDKWSDPEKSDPVANVAEGRQAIRSATGRTPNTMLLPYKVYENLKSHKDILERVKYSQLGVVTLDLLAAIFEVPRILLAGAVVDGANAGQAPALEDIWGGDVILAYVEPRPGIKKISLGYTFVARGFEVRRWREDPKHSDAFEASHIVGEELVAPDCGYLIKGAA